MYTKTKSSHTNITDLISSSFNIVRTGRWNVFLLLGIFFLATAPIAQALEVPSVFSDNMVLQQKTDAAVWGKAPAGEDVTVNGSWGAETTTTAGDDGTWKTHIETPAAGGPFKLEISGPDESRTFQNVLTGEVWLCSGQSNMEMPLKGWPPKEPVKNSDEAIQNANFPKLRLFTVQNKVAYEEQFDCEGSWKLCSPDTAAGFSATAFFFGRKIHNELDVPVGLIDSTWGGTPVESWTSTSYLKKAGGFDDLLERLDMSEEETKKYNEWLKNRPTLNVPVNDQDLDWGPVDFNTQQCSSPSFDDAGWPTMTLPTAWEDTGVGKLDGTVWFRKRVTIPEEHADQSWTLKLGPIDDMDTTYVNGTKVGGYETSGHWETVRSYDVSSDVLNAGENVIAVRVIDTGGGGGIYGSSDQLQLVPEDHSADAISLAGDWKYLPVAELRGGTFYLFGADGETYSERPTPTLTFDANTPTSLYNGMIAPLIPFTIQGAIWYQGESNAGAPIRYRTLFPNMIKNWRNDWGQGKFPFYFVQIAPFEYGKHVHSELLREAQMMTLSLPNTGMAVTLDIANPKKIHPARKEEVGNRLARWALAKTYDRDLVYSGPLYESSEVKNGEMILHFKHTGSGLTAKDGELTGFEIAGEDRTFYEANAEIDGDKVIVSHPEVDKPAAVRYAWSNTAIGSLFNEEGLPASSFRTDDWPVQ